MNPTPNQIAALQSLQLAQQALKNGEKHLARQHAEQAARLAPEQEDVWLMLAALSTPRGSVACLERALQINPHSERAQKGMNWALERVRKEVPRQQPPALEKTSPIAAAKPAAITEPVAVKPEATQPIAVRHQAEKPAVAPIPPKTVQPQAKKSDPNARSSFLAALVVVLCLFVSWVVWQTATPAAAFISSNLFSGQKNNPSWAQVDVLKPTQTNASIASRVPMLETAPALLPTLAFTPTATFTIAPLPTETPGLPPTDQPPSSNQPTSTPQPPDVASPTPLPTDTGVPEPTKFIPTPPAGAPGDGVRWLDIDLTNQTIYAYEGSTVVNSFIVSTGTWQYPTVTGQYNVYIKYRYKDMTGPGYYLPDVPYTMFFYQGYAIHGTYWHSNFGTPMSHGCVNLTIPDSEWIYNFASVGTLVNVHY